MHIFAFQGKSLYIFRVVIYGTFATFLVLPRQETAQILRISSWSRTSFALSNCFYYFLHVFRDPQIPYNVVNFLAILWCNITNNLIPSYTSSIWIKSEFIQGNIILPTSISFNPGFEITNILYKSSGMLFHMLILRCTKDLSKCLL